MLTSLSTEHVSGKAPPIVTDKENEQEHSPTPQLVIRKTRTKNLPPLLGYYSVENLEIRTTNNVETDCIQEERVYLAFSPCAELVTRDARYVAATPSFNSGRLIVLEDRGMIRVFIMLRFVNS